MFAPTAFVCLGLAAGPGPLETKFVEVSPTPREASNWERTPGRRTAVVLIHGCRPHPFSNDDVAKPVFHGWQRPGSALVKTLAKDNDVYAFAYGQNVPVDQVAHARDLRDGIRRLKRLGYSDIVLVGHSAGGLVARHFVEDSPNEAVTKVIQVCCPNGGSSLGKAKFAVRKSQEVFLDSLTKEGRQASLKKRAQVKIPEQIQFVCVVGLLQVDGNVTASVEIGDDPVEVRMSSSMKAQGDGVVTCRCQWTEDLQKQGVCAVPLATSHFSAMRSTTSADKFAELIREKHPRWDAAKVAAAREKLFDDRERRP